MKTPLLSNCLMTFLLNGLFVLAIPAAAQASPGNENLPGKKNALENLPPVAVCLSTPLTIYLDATGHAELIPSHLDGGSYDPENGPLTFNTRTVFYSCADIGSHEVGLIVSDNTGQFAGCIATLIVADNLPPMARCKNIDVLPGNNGEYHLQPSDIDWGSSDNCGIKSMTVTPATIPCTHQLFQEMVTLTVTDWSGNSSTCTSYVVFLGDSDCDGVGDLCDQCAGGNDQIDNDNNGIPDCVVFPGTGNIPDEWKCGAGSQKVLICHITPGDPTDRNTICVPPSALPAHLAHGDYIGPCDVTICDPRDGDIGSNELLGKETKDVLLYPNPATSLAYLDFTVLAGNPATISICNNYGKELYSRQFTALPKGQFIIPLDGYNNGFYFLSIRGKDFNRFMKLQINK